MKIFILPFLILGLFFISCSIKTITSESKNREEALIRGNIYLNYDCCDNLKTNYECHLYSVLKFYDLVYANLSTNNFNKFNDDIDAKIHLDFDSINKLDNIRVSTYGKYLDENYEDEILELVKYAIVDDFIACNKTSPNSSKKSIALDFIFRSDDMHCLDFLQDVSLEECDILSSRLDAVINYNEQEYELFELRDLEK